MRIGILTYHRAHNYGAVLQCYALQHYLRTLGHDVCVIDYKPSYFHYGLFVWYKWLSANPIKLIKKLGFQSRTFSIQRKRYLSFEKFIRTYIAPKQIELNQAQSSIDCFVFGSDQVWRKNGESFDPVFWGDFKAAQNAMLVSYAASMGKASLSEEEERQIKNWLSHFSSIMVREISLEKILSPLTDKKVNIVVDPTFLLSSKEWDKIATKPNVEKPYILLYQVIEHPAAYRFAKQAAQSLNAEIIEIASKVDGISKSHRVIYDSSPNDFVGFIANATMVITTSFHGTAFSIIYRRPFISIKQNKPSDLRIASILETCNLSDRFIDCESQTFPQTVFDKPNPSLDAVNVSKQYLNTI